MGTEWSLFKSHIEAAKRSGFDIVDEINSEKGQIQVCFDDGWLGIYDKREEITRMGIHPTVFIAVDLIGTEGHLTLDQIIEMKQIGFIFEGHTWTHGVLPGLSKEQLQKEIISSKKKLSEMIQSEINAICFPCGKYSDEVVALSRQAGYTKLYSSNSGSYCTLKNQGLICRKLCQGLGHFLFKCSVCSDSQYLLKHSINIHKKR